jgi:hypothetical protein
VVKKNRKYTVTIIMAMLFLSVINIKFCKTEVFDENGKVIYETKYLSIILPAYTSSNTRFVDVSSVVRTIKTTEYYFVGLYKIKTQFECAGSILPN